MMVEKGELILRVKAVLNESGEEASLLITDDYVKLDDYVERALPDAVALLAKDGVWMNPKEFGFSSDTQIVNPPIGRCSLPDDFLSFISLEVEDLWKKPATVLVQKGSVEYKRAKNEFTAPGVYSPVCWKEGNSLIGYAPLTEQSKYVCLTYNAKLNEALYGDEKAVNAVVYMAAALVCSFFENDKGKQRLSELAISFMQ